MAYPGILTGAILALSRAIGETAPLVVVGALTFITFVPDGIDAPFTALPIQIFNWMSRPQPAFVVNAAAGIVVLLFTMLLLNGGAIYLRNRLQKRNAV
jgi:phosphate transport system permease protein